VNIFQSSTLPPAALPHQVLTNENQSANVSTYSMNMSRSLAKSNQNLNVNAKTAKIESAFAQNSSVFPEIRTSQNVNKSALKSETTRSLKDSTRRVRIQGAEPKKKRKRTPLTKARALKRIKAKKGFLKVRFLLFHL
jgi:hypothetical protein